MTESTRHGCGSQAEASRPSRPGSPEISPRLLNLRQGAIYVGCSFWTLRDYVLQSLIPVVELPPLRPREGERPRKTLRRVVIDRTDLDAFIERLKHGGERDVQSRARPLEAGNARGNRASVPGLCPPEAAKCAR